MDETDIKTSSSKPPKTFSLKGKKQVGVIRSTERGQLTTVICCCNAAAMDARTMDVRLFIFIKAAVFR